MLYKHEVLFIILGIVVGGAIAGSIAAFMSFRVTLLLLGGWLC